MLLGWTLVKSTSLQNGNNKLHVSSDLHFTKYFRECHASLPATQSIFASRMESAMSIRTNMDSRNIVVDTSEKVSSKLWLFSSLF